MPLNIPHKIERTNNRSSVARIVDGLIVIRLAAGLDSSQEREHIDVLMKRMAKAFIRLQETIAVDPFRAVLPPVGQKYFCPTGGKINLQSGKIYELKIYSSSRSRVTVTPAGWVIERGPRLKSRALHRLLWKLVSTRETQWLQQYVQELNRATLSVRIENVKLRYLQSKWGSCSNKGDVTLNTALLFLPASILNYVIVHELAHHLHPNHSRKFWETVGRVMPDYEERRKALRGFRLMKL